jgi:predicted DNA-binding transcriptional regulator YafY
MRQIKAQQLLTLAIAMQASSIGMSLKDIGDLFLERFGEKISRRTAERMRDSLLRMFPQLYSVDSDDGLKRWKLPKSLINNMVRFSAEELASFKNAVKEVKSKGLSTDVSLLQSLSDKVEALIPRDEHTRLLPDIQALTEAEGIAYRPGPSNDNSSRDVILNIRTAILEMKKIYIHYYWQESDAISKYKVEPYGFLYGNKNYLVAYNRHNSDYRNYSLSQIQKVEIFDEYFDKDESFSFEEYTKHMFGSFREEPFKVKLEFSSDVQKQVMDFNFHPTQIKKVQSDGKVTVELHVGGNLELCWHLFQWGTAVKILAPAKLRKQYCQMVKEVYQFYK